QAEDGIRDFHVTGVQTCALPILTNRDALKEMIRRESGTTYHPSTTCKMGPKSDPMAVVDTAGRVYGVSNLRVADASIFPFGPREIGRAWSREGVESCGAEERRRE